MGYNLDQKPVNVTGADVQKGTTIYLWNDNYVFNEGDDKPATKGRVMLLFFKEVTVGETPLDWITSLDALYSTYGSTNFGIYLICYNMNIPIDISDLINAIAPYNIQFNVICDSAWASSITKPFFDNFGGTVTDPFYYLIDKYCRISAKTLGMITENVITSALAGPTIVQTAPPKDSYQSSLTTVSITFSEDVRNADNVNNFVLSGNGRGNVPATPNQVTYDSVQKKAVLTLGAGSLATGDLIITLSNITDKVFYTPVPLSGGQFSYHIDVEKPVVSLCQPNFIMPTKMGVQVPFHIQGSDNKGITMWALTVEPSISIDSSAWQPVDTPGTNIDITKNYTLLSSGIKTVYAWLKDNAGNISIINPNKSHCQVMVSPWNGILVRDYLSDIGIIPTSGNLYTSPDIISNGTSKEHAEDFSSASSYSHDVTSHEPKSTVKNYFYVRGKNMEGNLSSGNAKVYLYWANASLSLWDIQKWITNPLKVDGTDQPLDTLPAIAENAIFVSSPFYWQPTDTGHRCLITIVSTPNHQWDPNNLPIIRNETEFANFVANNPNIGWRNVTIAQAPQSANTGGPKASQRGGGIVKPVPAYTAYKRSDELNNVWNKDLDLLITITLNVPKGTLVTVEDQAIGIQATKFTAQTGTETFSAHGKFTKQAVAKPGTPVQPMVRSVVNTTVEIPNNSKMPDNAFFSVSSYIKDVDMNKSAKKPGLQPSVAPHKSPVPVMNGPTIREAMQMQGKPVHGAPVYGTPVHGAPVSKDNNDTVPEGYKLMGTCTTKFA